MNRIKDSNPYFFQHGIKEHGIVLALQKTMYGYAVVVHNSKFGEYLKIEVGNQQEAVQELYSRLYKWLSLDTMKSEVTRRCKKISQLQDHGNCAALINNSFYKRLFTMELEQLGQADVDVLVPDLAELKRNEFLNKIKFRKNNEHTRTTQKVSQGK